MSMAYCATRRHSAPAIKALWGQLERETAGWLTTAAEAMLPVWLRALLVEWASSFLHFQSAGHTLRGGHAAKDSCQARWWQLRLGVTMSGQRGDGGALTASRVKKLFVGQRMWPLRLTTQMSLINVPTTTTPCQAHVGVLPLHPCARHSPGFSIGQRPTNQDRVRHMNMSAENKTHLRLHPCPCSSLLHGCDQTPDRNNFRKCTRYFPLLIKTKTKHNAMTKAT